MPDANALLREIMVRREVIVELRPSQVRRVEAYRARLNTPEAVAFLDDEPTTFGEALVMAIEDGLRAKERSTRLIADEFTGALAPYPRHAELRVWLRRHYRRARRRLRKVVSRG